MFKKKLKLNKVLSVSDLINENLINYFIEITQEKKIDYLKKLNKDQLLSLYVYFSVFVDALYDQELEPSRYSEVISSLMIGYLKSGSGSLDERKLLSKMFESVLPVLFYVEKSLGFSLESTDNIDVDIFDFSKLVLLLAICSLKVHNLEEDIPVIPLKTSELKLYSRARIKLDPEDEFVIRKEKKNGKVEEQILNEICYFIVGPHKVLCGFFTKNNTWISESYLNIDQKRHILKKYKLASRSYI